MKHSAAAPLAFVSILLYGLSPSAARTQSLGDSPPASESSVPLPRLDDDGTLHTDVLALPPSPSWSPQFRDAFTAHMRGTMGAPTGLGLPSANAPLSAWDEFDQQVERGAAPRIEWYKQHFAVQVEETHIDGVRVAIVTPDLGVAINNRRSVLINFHGFGHGLSEGLLESIPIAGIGRIKVVTVDYRSAPKFKYPASSDYALRVYKQLLKTHRASAIGIYGASAGGVLTSQVLAQLQKQQLPNPGAAGIFWSGLAAAPYPWGPIGDSKVWGFRAVPRADFTEVDAIHKQLGDAYLEGVDSNDASAYPASSDPTLKRFPPILFLTGTRAIDLSPSINSHAHLLKLGVDSSLYVMEGAWHGANFGGAQDSPEEYDANAYIAQWFDRHLSQRPFIFDANVRH